jgi:hypothetical protein
VTSLSIQDGADSVGFAFIGAVHGLLKSARSTTKADLILAAVMQALFEADRDEHQILQRVHEIWPGARPTSDDICAALTLGTELALLAQAPALDNSTVWTLTKSGAQDVQQHEAWVADTRERAAAQVRERALDGMQTKLEVEQSELLLDRLVRALALGIQASQDPYLGRVDALLTGQIVPRSFDRARVLASIGDGDDPNSEFLRTLVLSALDPLDPFGNDLVSHITTGCVLHAYAAGVDRQRLLAKIGEPRGQRVILDAPILIDLLGPRRLAAGLENTIGTAIDAGWEVVALEHSIEEAQQVLHREVPNIAEDFRSAAAQGMRETWYAALTADQLPSLCIEVLRDGTYKNLEQLVLAADRLTERLTGLGVTVRPHGNGDDSRVQRLHEALEKHLEGVTSRSQTVIARDANSMAMAWRYRRRSHGKWPGAWIVTKDRAMFPVYASVNTQDKVSLTVTPGQWATLLAVSAAPITVEELAEAAASQFVDEAMWALPVRFPPDVAFDLARQLSPEHGGSGTDVRVAQLTLDDALDAAPSSTALAASVLSARQRRVNNISQAESKRLARGMEAEQSKATEATVRALESERARLESEQSIKTLRSDQETLQENLGWRETQVKRMATSFGVLALTLVLVVISVFLADSLTWALLGVGFLVLLVGCFRWCTGKDRSLAPILVGGVFDLVGVVSGLLQIFDAF